MRSHLETSDPTDAEEEGWPALADPDPAVASDAEVAPATDPSDASQEPYQEPYQEPPAQEPFEEPAAQEPFEEPAAQEPYEEPAAQEPYEEPAAQEPFDGPVASEAAVAPAAAPADANEGEDAELETAAPVVASEELSVEAAPVFGRDEDEDGDGVLVASGSEGAPAPASPDAGPEEGEGDDEELAAYAVPPRPPGRSAAVIALLVTTALMAIATGAVWFMVLRQTQERDTVDTARTAALEASRDAARVLFSYDYRTLDKDFSAGRAVATGAFLTQYTETTSKVVTNIAKEKKAVVKAEVVTAGVVRASERTVVTIVYVNQVTTSSLAAGPKVDLSRVRMTLVKVGDDWRVSKVEAL
ncbi:MAG: hypothetical protein JJD92_13455 [Frankiaceae bacterium]|nr:hypothetical protein [Frankiaceae bacterium]